MDILQSVANLEYFFKPGDQMYGLELQLN